MVPDVCIAAMRVGPVVVPLPRYETHGSAGMDLRAAVAQPLTIPPLGRVRVPTGLAVAIPQGFEAQIRPRSGIASKSGVTVLNAPGTVDSDFRGQIEVLLVNLSDAPAEIEPLDRIAQLVVAPVARAELLIVDTLEPTVRGEGGYGSTGRR
jgi:dUTP pyrophosphatase